MTNLVHALNLATDLAGFMFTDRSDNRSTDGGNYNVAYITRNRVKQRLNGMRAKSMPKPGANRDQILAYGATVLAEQIGNCFEISCAAAHTLETNYGVKNWDIVYYNPKGDHIFLAIGDCGDHADDFSDWPDDCAIFDGWAQIACMASNYKPKWSAKMSEWAATTPEVKLPSPTGSGGFGAATDWRTVVTWKKASYLG